MVTVHSIVYLFLIPVIEDPRGLLLAPGQVSDLHCLRDNRHADTGFDGRLNLRLQFLVAVLFQPGFYEQSDLVSPVFVIDEHLIFTAGALNLLQSVLDLSREHIDAVHLDHVVRPSQNHIYAGQRPSAGAGNVDVSYK